MPTVPRYEPQVSAAGLPNAKLTDYAPIEAFGGGQASRGLSAAGSAMQQFAEQERQRADASALMSADNEAWLAERDLFHDPDNGVFAKRGQESFGVQDKVFPEYDKRLDQVEQRLTDRQRLRFKEMRANRRQALEKSTLSFVAGEAEKFYADQIKATVASNIDEAAVNYTDEGKISQVIGNVTGAIQLSMPGASGQAHDFAVRKAVSDIHAEVFNRWLVADPGKAEAYYEKHKSEMTGEAQADAEKILLPQILDVEADRRIADLKAGVEYAIPAGAATSIKDAESIAAQSVGRIIKLESNGSPSAKNGASTATGSGQFLDGTWIEVMGRNAPGLVAGRSRSEVLAMRHDPEISRQMTEAYAKENARALFNAGFAVTPETIYLAHHFGQAGARKILRAPADTPMKNLLTAEEINANPYLKDKTVAEVISTHAARAGGTSPATSYVDLKRLALDEPNTRLRERMLNKIEMADRVEKQGKAEFDESMRESINSKIESANPADPIRVILSPAELEWADKEGRTHTLESVLAQRAQGTQSRTDPVELERLQVLFTKAENGDAGALAEVRLLDPTTLYSKLSPQSRDYVQKRRQAIVAPRKTGNLDYASEDSQLETFVWSKIGIAPGQGNSEANAALKNEFREKAYWPAVKAKQAEKGRPLNSDEREAIMKSLVLPFAVTVKDSFLGISYKTTEQKPRYKLTEEDMRNADVPDDVRASIIKRWLDAPGSMGVPPTEVQVRQFYLAIKDNG